MQQTFRNVGIDRTDKKATPRPDGAYEVRVALVYQDHGTRQWAGQVRERIAELVTKEAISCTEWNINDLKEPVVFSQGVASLARADLIVVSVYEAERLPSVFYLWVNLWLQVRSGHQGALITCVVPTGDSESGERETRRYLCAVATQGQLQMLECKRPSTPIRGLRGDVFQWSEDAQESSPFLRTGANQANGHRIAARQLLDVARRFCGEALGQALCSPTQPPSPLIVGP